MEEIDYPIIYKRRKWIIDFMNNKTYDAFSRHIDLSFRCQEESTLDSQMQMWIQITNINLEAIIEQMVEEMLEEMVNLIVVPIVDPIVDPILYPILDPILDLILDPKGRDKSKHRTYVCVLWCGNQI